MKTLNNSMGQQDSMTEQPWWVAQWMDLINSYRYKRRLERAWEYMHEGHVMSIRFEGRRVHARVQGAIKDPYKVKLWLDTLSNEDWNYVLDALSQKARWAAQLLAGVMPQDIERAFAASGRRLFPWELREVRSECNCPDQVNPCKHIIAVYYLMGDRFSEDPFVLFQLRGRTRQQLLDQLAQRRISNATEQGVKVQTGILPPQARRTWSYGADMDPELVVITPALEGELGVDEAGSLLLAPDIHNPDANHLFLHHLREQGQQIGQQAMSQAMNMSSEPSN